MSKRRFSFFGPATFVPLTASRLESNGLLGRLVSGPPSGIADSTVRSTTTPRAYGNQYPKFHWSPSLTVGPSGHGVTPFQTKTNWPSASR